MRTKNPTPFYIGGTVLLVYIMVVCVLDLHHVLPFQEKLLGLLGASLAGIVGWAIPGKSVLSARFTNRAWGHVALDASGSITCFFFVLLWWTSGVSPIEQNRGKGLKDWISELPSDVRRRPISSTKPIDDAGSEAARVLAPGTSSKQGDPVPAQTLGGQSHSSKGADEEAMSPSSASPIQVANYISLGGQTTEIRPGRGRTNAISPGGAPSDASVGTNYSQPEPLSAATTTAPSNVLVLRKADFNPETFLPTGTYKDVPIDPGALAKAIISITSVNQYLPHALMMTRFQNGLPVEAVELQLSRLADGRVFAFGSKGSLFLERGDPAQTFGLLTRDWKNCYWLDSSVGAADASAWIPGGGYLIRLWLSGNRLSFDVTNSIIDVTPLRVRQKPGQVSWPR